MTQTLKNLRIWLGFAVLAVLLMLALTGNFAFARKGQACSEASGPGAPGFAVLPAGGAAPACLRFRIG